MKIELIKWVDTFGCAQGWEFEDEIERKVTTVSSVGFVREETEKYVLLVPHISDAERKQVAGCICIPRKQIVERLELVKEEKTSKRSTTGASKEVFLRPPQYTNNLILKIDPKELEIFRREYGY